MKLMVFVPADPLYPHIQPITMRAIQSLKWLEPFEILIIRDDKPQKADSLEAKYQNIADKHRRARAVFLASDYDAMLTVDSDIIIPPDALLKMSKVKADIVYGLYCSRPNPKHHWMLRIGDLEPKAFDTVYMRSIWGKVISSDGLGHGCTFIHRHVLEAITIQSGTACNDWYMARDAKALGFTQKTDCSVICGHTLDNGNVIWPDPDKGYKIIRRRR